MSYISKNFTFLMILASILIILIYYMSGLINPLNFTFLLKFFASLAKLFISLAKPQACESRLATFKPFANLLNACLASLASSSANLSKASCKPFASLFQAFSYKLISVCTVVNLKFSRNFKFKEKFKIHFKITESIKYEFISGRGGCREILFKNKIYSNFIEFVSKPYTYYNLTKL